MLSLLETWNRLAKYRLKLIDGVISNNLQNLSLPTIDDTIHPRSIRIPAVGSGEEQGELRVEGWGIQARDPGAFVQQGMANVAVVFCDGRIVFVPTLGVVKAIGRIFERNGVI